MCTRPSDSQIEFSANEKSARTIPRQQRYIFRREDLTDLLGCIRDARARERLWSTVSDSRERASAHERESERVRDLRGENENARLELRARKIFILSINGRILSAHILPNIAIAT